MTLRELVLALDAHTPLVLGALAAVPAAAFALGRSHPPGGGGAPPWRGLYAVLVYAACVPGMFAASLVAYALFTGDSLLDASLVVYFAPLVTMAAAVAVMRMSVDFDQVPGFDRIGGLLGLLGTTFLSALILQRLYFVVVMKGSMTAFVGFAALIFVALRWSARRLLGPGHPGRP